MPIRRPSDVSWLSSLPASTKFTLITVMWFGLAALAWFVVGQN